MHPINHLKALIVGFYFGGAVFSVSICRKYLFVGN